MVNRICPQLIYDLDKSLTTFRCPVEDLFLKSGFLKEYKNFLFFIKNSWGYIDLRGDVCISRHSNNIFAEIKEMVISIKDDRFRGNLLEFEIRVTCENGLLNYSLRLFASQNLGERDSSKYFHPKEIYSGGLNPTTELHSVLQHFYYSKCYGKEELKKVARDVFIDDLRRRIPLSDNKYGFKFLKLVKYY